MRAVIPVCPKCDVGLFLLHFKAVEVDYCERCRGVWLDAGEFETMMRVTGATPADPLMEFSSRIVAHPRRTQYLCPRCDQRLEEIGIADKLLVDRCPRGHGLWFDANELQQLLALYPPGNHAARTIEYLNEIFGQTATT